MNLANQIIKFLSNPIFTRFRTLFILWFSIAVIAWVTKIIPGSYNNFLIFRGVFFNLINQLNLYLEYPLVYKDVNLYGPLFSLVVAPFAVVPVWLGLLMWLCSLSVLLYFSVKLLPIEDRKKIFIYWICAHELLTALFMSQFNIVIVSIILLSYTFIKKEKDWLATLLIVIGIFTKIYGVVGLALFLFSRHKIKFIGWFIFWSIIAFVLPMLITSPDYIIEQYSNWFGALQAKAGKNLFSTHQNISLLGIIRKVSGNEFYSDIYPIICGCILFTLPYLRFAQYKYDGFKLGILASILLFVVLFSTGSESSTYIIAFVGVALWYVNSSEKRSNLDLALLIFAFILTSMSPSDLLPSYIRKTFVMPYALKALPCVIIWFKLIYELCTRDYSIKLK